MTKNKIKKDSTARSVESFEPFEETKTFKNNSAFKRAMVQMNVKSGDKITVTYSDGSTYTVESI